MCVIVDANLASLVFAFPRRRDFAPFWDWIEKKDGVLVYGGALARELKRVGKAARYLQQMVLAGKAVRPDSEEALAREEKAVRETGLCRSDDPHVIALARVTKARVLCSRDKDLHTDFKDLRLVPSPRGCIYQDQRHAHLLGHTVGCVGGRASPRR